MSTHPILLNSDFFDAFGEYISRLRNSTFGLWSVAAELLLIGAIVYAALRFLQGTRGERVLKSFGLILVISFLVVRLIADKLELHRVNFLYPYFVGGVILTTLIAFQPEIRRGFVQLGEARWLRSLSGEIDRVIAPIITAVSHLSQKKIGALIAIQRDVGLGAVAEGGVKLDAEVSASLLESIFWPGTPLHDLGVIIHHTRIVAAACQFPIAESGELAQTLGSRHRAAIGLSHDCDAIIIVVSEETGTISIAHKGTLRRGFTADKLTKLLRSALTDSDKSDSKKVEAAESEKKTEVLATRQTAATTTAPLKAET